VIALGLVVLGLCSLAGRILGGATGTATAAIVFLPLWLAGTGINMYFGVKRAGYSIAGRSRSGICAQSESLPGKGEGLLQVRRQVTQQIILAPSRGRWRWLEHRREMSRVAAWRPRSSRKKGQSVAALPDRKQAPNRDLDATVICHLAVERKGTHRRWARWHFVPAGSRTL